MASELTEIAKHLRDPELIFQGHWFRLHDLLELGHPEALSEVDICLECADRLKQPLYSWLATAIRGVRPSIEGNWVEVDRLAEEALRIGENTIYGAAYAFRVQNLTTDVVQRYAELVQFLAYAADHCPTATTFPCMLAYVHAENGHLPEARVAFDQMAADEFASLPRDVSGPFSTVVLAVTCAALNDSRRAVALSWRAVRG